MTWCETVAESGGAVVLSLEGWDAATAPDDLLPLALRCSARGGAMRDLPPGDGR